MVNFVHPPQKKMSRIYGPPVSVPAGTAVRANSVREGIHWRDACIDKNLRKQQQRGWSLQ